MLGKGFSSAGSDEKKPFLSSFFLSKDEGFAISKIGFDRTYQGSVDLTVLSPARKPLVSMDMDVILFYR